jgi:uncharacterized protein (DUF427 family)
MTTTPGLAGATVTAYPYRARAWWGEQLLADSTRALRVEVPGRTPTLWFPWDDVQTTHLRVAGNEAADGEEYERYDADGPAPQRDEVTWADAPERPLDGAGVVRRCITAPDACAELRNLAVIDHDRAGVAVV